MAVNFDDLYSKPATESTSSSNNVNKFLDFIGKQEGANYDTITGGSTFSDYSQHPGVVGSTTAEGPSTAAGRYQITKSTYDAYAKKLGITDFSPDSQDKIAIALIKDKGAYDDVSKGDYENAVKKLGGTWASFSSSPYSQPKHTPEQEKKTINSLKSKVNFDDLLNTLPKKPDFKDLVPKKEETLLDAGKQVVKNLYEAAKTGEGLVLSAGNVIAGTPEFVTKVAATPYFGVVSALDNAKDKKIAAIDWAEASSQASKVANWAFGPLSKAVPAAAEAVGLKKEADTSLISKGLEKIGQGIEWTGKKVEEQTGIPAKGTEAVLETLMVTGVPGAKYAYGKVKETLKPKEKQDVKTYGDFMGPLDLKNVHKYLSEQELADPDVHKFIELSDKVSRAEKISDPDTWTDAEKAAYANKDWKEFSRLRGYTQSEISDFENYTKLSNVLQERYGKDNPDYTASLDHLISQSIKEPIKSKKESLEQDLNKVEQKLKSTETSDVGSGLTSDVEEASKTLSTDPIIGNKSETGVPIKQGPILSDTGEPLLDSTGQPRLAIMRRDELGNPSHIEINLEEVNKRFNEKPWVTKLGLPEDTFKTPEQYARFILKHEEEHVLQSFDNWKTENNMHDSGIPEAVLRRQYETDVNKRAKAKADAEIDQTLQDHGILYELGDVFKDDTYTEQTPLNAIHRTLADIALNIRQAKIWRQSIEALIPNKKIRERMTMAIEAERKTDKLLGDKEKADLLYGTGKVKENGFKDEGLTGILARMLDKIDKAPDGVLLEYYDSKTNVRSMIPKEEYIQKAQALDHVINTLKKLPSEEKAIEVLKTIQDKLAVIGEQAKAEKLIDAMRQNYITHVIDFSDSTLSKSQQRSLLDRIALEPKGSRLNRDFAEHRVYRYIRDLEKRVYDVANEMGLDTTGLKVQRDIARIAEVYHESFVNATIQKRLANFLENKTIDLPDGTKLGLLTKDYNLGFENNYVKFTGRGSEILKDYMVNPDIVPALGHLFSQTDPDLALRVASTISMLSKTLTTMASLFHATSLLVARTTATPFGMIKELVTGFSGTRSALETLRHDGHSAEVDAWTRAGLKFETEDIEQGVLPGVAKSVDNFITKALTGKDVKVTRHLIDPLDEHVLQKLNNFTWNFNHAAGKFSTAQYLFAKMKASNPEMRDEAIYNEVSAFVNNTFGGLDWLKLADEVQNKTLKNVALKLTGLQGRTWMQVLMFAPDWTISTLRSYSKALPKETLKPWKWEVKKGAQGLINPVTSGDLARRYVLTTGLLYLIAINGINMAITGRPIWTNQDPTRIDLGDGTTMQLAKHSMEGPHWILHPIKTGLNKLGYIPKTIVSLGSPYVNTPLDALKVMVDPFIPFQISAAINAPAGDRLKRAVASFVGVPIYGKPDKQHTDPDVKLENKIQRHETRHENKEEKMKRR